MPALPDGTYHPHRVRVESTGDMLNVVVEALPPDEEPFMVTGFGLAPTDDITTAVNSMLSGLGLEVDAWGAALTAWGPPDMGLRQMVLVGTTREVRSASWMPALRRGNTPPPSDTPAEGSCMHCGLLCWRVEGELVDRVGATWCASPGQVIHKLYGQIR